MTISYQSDRVVYACDGVTTTFPVPMPFFDNAHIVVIRQTIADGTNLVLPSFQYSLTGVGNFNGGTLEMSFALDAEFQLLILRNVPIEQLQDYVAHDSLSSETLERGFDYLTMICQGLEARLAIVETAGPEGAFTAQNVGAGHGIFRDQMGSVYSFKSLIAGAGMTITPGADSLTLSSTGGGGPSLPGSTSSWYRGDGNFSDTLTGPVTIMSGLPALDVLKSYITNAGANLKRWKLRQTLPDLFGLYAQDDAEVALYPAIEFKRAAAAVTTAAIGGRVLVGGATDDGASSLQVTGAVKLNTPLPVASGGSGASTAQAAINALTGVSGATGGQKLTKVGSNAAWKSDQFFDVKDYGAVGNGVTDDTTAIAAAFAAANAATAGVYFPAGTYLTSPIVVGVNVSFIRGDGPSKSKLYFKRQAYAANAAMLNCAGNTASITVFDLGIDVDNALFNNTWTVHYAATNFTARNMAITGQAAIGFMASAGDNMLIDRCRIFGTGAAGVAVGVYCDTSATAVTVDSLYQSGVHSYSVNLAGGSFNAIRNCRSYNASVFAFTLSNCQYSTIAGCFAFESGFEGFQLTDAQFCSVIGNRGVWSAAGADFGISINSVAGIGSKHNTITGNVVDNSYKAGIAIADSSDNVVSGNTLRNCGVRGMAVPPQGMMGIYTSAAAEIAVRNRFHDNNCTSEGAAVTYGFLETAAGGSTMDHTTLDNNHFTNVTTQATLVGANSRLSGRFHEGVALIGVLKAANFNSTGDQAIRINAGRYRINSIVVENASTSLTTAAGGFYTAAAKGGTAIVAAAQTYTANTAANKQTFATLAAGGQDTLALQTLYLSLTTPQGGAATADVYVYGYQFEASP